jgi:hypothetical protein
VIVTARAGHGYAEQAARDRVDAVVHGLGITLRKFPPETQEAQRREVSPLRIGDEIRRKLVLHKPIVGQTQRPIT